MTLKFEDREALVALKLKRAKEALDEAKGNIKMGFWRTSVSRTSS